MLLIFEAEESFKLAAEEGEDGLLTGIAGILGSLARRTGSVGKVRLGDVTFGGIEELLDNPTLRFGRLTFG